MILTIEDYERIFRVIHGLLLSERGDPVRACLYFGVFGALLLEDHHGLRAAPRRRYGCLHIGRPTARICGPVGARVGRKAVRISLLGRSRGHLDRLPGTTVSRSDRAPRLFCSLTAPNVAEATFHDERYATRSHYWGHALASGRSGVAPDVVDGIHGRTRQRGSRPDRL